MKTNDNIIDYGKWVVPTDWTQITLKQFQEIEKLNEEQSGSTSIDIRDMLHILCNKTKDEVNELPMDLLDMILEKLSFMQEPIKEEKPINYIMIDGEKYSVNFMEKLKFGEWVSADSIIKSDKHNYAALLAVICRKQGEIYDSKFEAEVFNDRVRLFEQQPITKVMPIVFFFIQLYVQSETLSKLYTAVEEALDQSAKSIETSQNLGICRKLFMRWQIMTLRKSLESSKNTSQTHSRSLRILLRKAKQKRHKINSTKLGERQ